MAGACRGIFFVEGDYDVLAHTRWCFRRAATDAPAMFILLPGCVHPLVILFMQAGVVAVPRFRGLRRWYAFSDQLVTTADGRRRSFRAAAGYCPEVAC